MSEKSTENLTKSDSNFAPTFVDHRFLPDINFNGHCLIKNISVPEKIINLYLSYKLGSQLRNLSTDFTLSNCLFGSVKLTKNVDLDKYKYSGYGIGLDSCSEFSLPEGTMGKNVIISGDDMNSSVHVDNKGKDILITGEGPTQGLTDTTLTAEAKYPINSTQSGKRFVLSLHYNGSNSFLFVNATKVYQFKAKKLRNKTLCTVVSSYISKDFTINNLKERTGLKGVVKFFSVDFNPIDTNNILHIHKYLIKRT